MTDHREDVHVLERYWQVLVIAFAVGLVAIFAFYNPHADGYGKTAPNSASQESVPGHDTGHR